MSAISELKEILEQTQTAEFVTTMLRDISATKLQAIRKEFEANQRYFAELHELMALVESYATEFKFSLESVPQRERIYVALTSNKRFYGSLNREIMQHLQTQLLNENTVDCLVIGQTGQQFARSQTLPVKPEYFDFAQDEPTEDEALQLIERLSVYKEVLIIHPTFVNSFQQNAHITDITHVPEQTKKRAIRTIDYLFEPDIPRIIEFFRTQIRLTLFQRVILETQVAFTGARLMKMQRAREKAGQMVKQQRQVIHKETNTVKNMRLLETFTGFNKKLI